MCAPMPNGTPAISIAPHIPIGQIIQKKVNLEKNAHITIVCASGYRANIAGSILKAMGYDDVFTLIGGMTAWNNANL